MAPRPVAHASGARRPGGISFFRCPPISIDKALGHPLCRILEPIKSGSARDGMPVVLEPSTHLAEKNVSPAATQNRNHASDISSAVSLEGVVKKYRDHTVLQSVCLKIEQGEFLTPLGPSGCGKTTLLNLIAGFSDADEGEIFIDGKPATTLPPYQRQIGIVFQNYALFPHMTVERNIGYGLRMRRKPAAEIAERVREVMPWSSSTA